MPFKLDALLILNAFILIGFAISEECNNINAQCSNTIASKTYGELKVVTDKECLYNTEQCVNGLLFEDKNGEMYCISKSGRKNEELKCGRKGNIRQL